MENNILRCGTCLHFKDGAPHPKFASVCSDLGTRDYNSAPDCYTPTPIKIVRAPVDVGNVGRLLMKLDADQMQVIGQLITQAPLLKTVGLKFGQPVYINLGGGEYLTNYFKGHVLGMIKSKSGDQVYVSSDLTFESNECQPAFRSLLKLMPDSLTNMRDFQVIREKLVEQGKLEAPVRKDSPHRMPLGTWLANNCPMPPDVKPEAYEPPSLDSAPSAWLQPFSTDDLSLLRLDKKTKVAKTNIMISDSDKKKQQDRARKRLNITEVINEDGTTTKMVQGAVPLPLIAQVSIAMPRVYR